MPVLTMSTVTVHAAKSSPIKGKKRFNKLVNQRNQVHSKMTNFGKLKDKMANNIQKGWERHEQAMKDVRENGLNGEGQMSTFNHNHGNINFSGTIGKHKGSNSNHSMEKSNNSLQATLLDGTIYSEGQNWEVEGNIKVGDINASMQHTLLNDTIRLNRGLDNGPNASIRAHADLFNVSGTCNFGTDNDAPIGIRLEGHIDANWGINASVNANIKDGINPLNFNNFGARIRGSIKLVIDHQQSETGERTDIAKVRMNNGTLNADIKWRELGSAISDFQDRVNVLSNGIDVV